MSLSLYWRRKWLNLRQPNTHYYRVQSLTGAEIAARAAKHKRDDARRQRWAERRSAFVEWWAIRLPSILATAGIGGAAVALAMYVSMQPVADQLAQDNLDLTKRVEEWRDVATRSATNEVTINLRGHAAEVRKSVKRIAQDM